MTMAGPPFDDDDDHGHGDHGDDQTFLSEHRHRFAFIHDIQERQRRQLQEEEENEASKFSIPFAPRPLRNFLSTTTTTSRSYRGSFRNLLSLAGTGDDEEIEIEVSWEEVARELVDDDESWHKIIDRIRRAGLVTSLGVMIVCSDIFLEKREEIQERRKKTLEKNNRRGIFAKRLF